MSETADEKLSRWQRMGGSGRWGIGVAVDIKAIEARLAALESSRPVQIAPETAVEGANDPGRDNSPALTDEEREAIEGAMWDYGQYADEMGLSAAGATERQATLRRLLERLG